ncbi:MAG: penicillin-binding protein 1B [Cocleimonas sp.]
MSDQKDQSQLDEDDILTESSTEPLTKEQSEALIQDHSELLTGSTDNQADSLAKEDEIKGYKDDKEKKSSIVKGGFLGIVALMLGGLWRITRIVILVGIVIGALLAAVYVLKQDDVVRKQFEGKRWALPARVFARPLELYEGQTLKADDLHKELQLLNYSYVTHVMGTGQFKRTKNTFFIQTRGFKFAEDQEISRRIRIELKKDKIVSLSNTESTEPLTLMRLEPVLIGNFYPHHNEDRVLVKLDDVSDLLEKGLVAVEDRNFYDHFGINPKSIVRAVMANAKAGRKVQGGSTLTQQLVKNFYLSNERSYKRKINEATMAMLLEVHYSKKEILEAYVNEIYLGQNKQRAVHGFGLASQFYFNKPISELRPEQIALLIGMAKGASYYNPRRRPQRALERRNLVLEIMHQEGVFDAKTTADYKARPLGVTKVSPPSVSPFPSYLELVRQQLQRDYKEEDLRSEGLLIFTSMDPIIQIHSEEVLSKRIAKLEKSSRMGKNKLDGALVVSSVQGAEILALVGGRNARFQGYNRALSASRQIGSLIKPVVYLSALEGGLYTMGSSIDSGPVTVRLSKTKIWKPKNYNPKELGMVSFESALVHSLNTPTVRIGITSGLENVITTLHKLGLNKAVQPNPSLLLGALQLTPIEVQQVYQTIASSGTYTPLKSIRSVMNSYGKTLKRYPLQVKQVVPEELVYLLTHAMNKITKEGTAQYLSHILPKWKNSAGKTGTTNKNIDSWFSGFTGQHVATVWVGRDDNKPTKFTGSDGALRVWGDLIKNLNTKPFKPKRPRNIKYYKIDKSTGFLYNPRCGVAETIPFIKGTEPDEVNKCLAPEAEIYYQSDEPTWSTSATQEALGQSIPKGKGNAKIWNEKKTLSPAIKKVTPSPKKSQKDDGSWIGDLLKR